MDIGTLLRKLRDKNGFSTRYLAEVTGVSKSTYTDWENDRTSPSIKNYMKLAKAFGLSPVDFMSYLTGDMVGITRSEDTASELKQLITYCLTYIDILRKDQASMETELINIRKELKQQQPS